MTGIRRRVSPARRRAVAFLAVTAALSVVWCPAEPAGAAVTTFTLSPESGPPGTVVQVRGRGCAPGVLGSADANFVAVSVATFGVVLRAPVKADGRWNGSFTVPASGGSLGSSAPVTATCVSTGVASLTTIYTPQSFSVTAASPPTTGPDTPPSTDEPSDRTVVIPGDTATAISVPRGEHSRGEDGDAAGASSGGDQPTTSVREREERAPEAATLRPAGLDTRSAAGTDGTGLGWLGWSLLLILLIAALGASGYVWRARHLSDASPGGMA